MKNYTSKVTLGLLVGVVCLGFGGQDLRAEGVMTAPLGMAPGSAVDATRTGSGVLKDPTIGTIATVSQDGLTKLVTKIKAWRDVSGNIEKEESDVESLKFERVNLSSPWEQVQNSRTSKFTIVDLTKGLSDKDTHRQTIVKTYVDGALHSTTISILEEEFDEKNRATHLKKTEEVVVGQSKQFSGYVKDAQYSLKDESHPKFEKTVLYNRDGSMIETEATFHTTRFNSSLPVKEILNTKTRETNAQGDLIREEDAQQTTQWHAEPYAQIAKISLIKKTVDKEGVETNALKETVYDIYGEIRRQYASFAQPKNEAKNVATINWYGFYELDELGHVIQCDGFIPGSNSASNKEKESLIRNWVDAR